MSQHYRVAVIGRTGQGNYGHDLDTVWLDLPETEIGTSAGVGVPEPLPEYTLRRGNGLIARDLIRCIKEGAQPLGSIYDGRAALEMVLAVYESHRVNAPVALPLWERRHPLRSLGSQAPSA